MIANTKTLRTLGLQRTQGRCSPRSGKTRWSRRKVGTKNPVLELSKEPLGIDMMPDRLKPTMLVVDDEPLVRLDLAEMLVTAGYQTLEAGSAAEAIVMLDSHPDIRVIFTDIQMPGTMDGLALAHFVRERWPPTIIVICSGNCAPAPNEMPTDANFIAKPFASTEMDRILDNLKTRFPAV